MLLCLALCLCTVSAFAAPRISALEDPKTVEINTESLSEEITAELAGDKIYTSRAVTEQYDDEMSSVIELAEQTFEETGDNGRAVEQSIPSVEQIFANIPGPARESKDWVDLSSLKQLTYMQDFKRESTDWRVVTSETLSQVIELTISDSEVVKSGRKEDFVIIQVNPETKQFVCLQMKEYNPETGTFTVDFPSFGPYMIAQIM